MIESRVISTIENVIATGKEGNVLELKQLMVRIGLLKYTELIQLPLEN